MFPKSGPNPFARIQYGKLIQISDHVYIFRNTVNSGVIVSEDGVAVVDTQISEPMAHRLIRAIRQVTDKPIRWAINTHYHWDHWAGNDVFARTGAQLVCGHLTREFMQHRNKRQRAFLTGRGFSMPPHDPQHPSMNFDGKLDLPLGKLKLELRHIGSAETDDATAVHIPSDRVSITGDTLMTGAFPILGQPVTNEGLGRDRAWNKTLDNLRAFGGTQFIPGHGPVGSVEDIVAFQELNEYFLARVEELEDDGLSDAEIIAKMEAELPEKYKKIPVTWGTARYAILRVLRSFRGWQHEKPLVIPVVAAADLEAETRGLEPTGASWRAAAEGALTRERPDLALAILSEGTKACKDDPAVWTEYGRLLIEMARVERSVLEKGDYFLKARQALEKALSLDPNHGPALVTLGGYIAMGCFRGGDDPAPAFAHLNRAMNLPLEERDRAQAHFFRGMAFRALEDEEKAVAELKAAIAADATFAPPHMALAPSELQPVEAIRASGR